MALLSVPIATPSTADTEVLVKSNAPPSISFSVSVPALPVIAVLKLPILAASIATVAPLANERVPIFKNPPPLMSAPSVTCTWSATLFSPINVPVYALLPIAKIMASVDEPAVTLVVPVDTVIVLVFVLSSAAS